MESLVADPNAPVDTVQVLSEEESAGDDESIERELQMNISEMTSLDMSEVTGASKASSKITKMLSFGKRLSKINKKSSDALPGKISTTQSVRSNKGRVKMNPKRIAPTFF